MQSVRQVTILYSNLVSTSDPAASGGADAIASIHHQFRALNEIVITRDDLGQVLQAGEDHVYATFDTPSVALNRALELQRLFSVTSPNGQSANGVRFGLHSGEVVLRNGDQVELANRHMSRARHVAESASPGQIFASESVLESGRELIDLPPSALSIQSYGEYYLPGAGPTLLCELADLRFRHPAPPRIPTGAESSLLRRLELAGFSSLKRIGEGPHGVVYQATENRSGTAVAIKVLRRPLTDRPEVRRQVDAENDRLRRLGLPNTAHIVETRLDHSPPCLIIEMIRARPATDALADADSTTIAAAFLNVTRVLANAHANGVIHGDLKAGNVLLYEDGTAIIVDFISRFLDEAGEVNAATLAPERIRGGAPSPQADLYALGMLLFNCLTRTELFARNSLHQTILAHLHEDPPLPAILRPDIADGIQRVCLKALEKDPADRYPSAAAMAADLERFLNGHAVQTRPTLYDNLLYHRVQRQVTEVGEWTNAGLLTEEESNRIVSAYEGLQRRGIPALMEAGLFRFWQTFVYLGGWALVNGALLWLTQHWNELGRAEKLTLGSVPLLTSLGLGIAMWALERFRLAFVALVVAILAVPVCAGVWLHELQWAGTAADYTYELFHQQPGSTQLTNRQITLTALATFMVAALIAWRTRTTTHSAQTLIALAALYLACLLLLGLKPRLELPQIQWANIALQFVPLLLVTALTARSLLSTHDRRHQATPWIFFGAGLCVTLSLVLPRFGLRDWLQVQEPILTPASWLATSLSGALLTAIGVHVRSRLRHRCRTATLGMILAGQIFVLAGLALAAADSWPERWWTPSLFGTAVPAAHLLLPFASLGITLLACRRQMVSFLLVGLAGFAASIHFLGFRYFDTASGWPKLVMTLGAIAFFGALYLELRRTRGNTIDDVVRTTRL